MNLSIGIALLALLALGGYYVYQNVWGSGNGDQTLNRSLEQWQLFVEENPESSLGRANLAATYLDLGKTDEAIEQLEIALQQEPESFVYMEKLGLAFRQAGDYDAAVGMFRQSADLTPEGEKYRPLFWAGQSLYDKGDLSGAKDYLEQSIADNDIVYNSHYLLAQIYEQEGDLEKAKEEYESAAVFNPNDAGLQEAIDRVSG